MWTYILGTATVVLLLACGGLTQRVAALERWREDRDEDWRESGRLAKRWLCEQDRQRTEQRRQDLRIYDPPEN